MRFGTRLNVCAFRPDGPAQAHRLSVTISRYAVAILLYPLLKQCRALGVVLDIHGADTEVGPLLASRTGGKWVHAFENPHDIEVLKGGQNGGSPIGNSKLPSTMWLNSKFMGQNKQGGQSNAVQSFAVFHLFYAHVKKWCNRNRREQRSLFPTIPLAPLIRGGGTSLHFLFT